MKQSKQALEMLDLMSLVDEVNLDETSSQDLKGKASLPKPGPSGSASGPGTVNRKTPNDYTQDQVVDMLQFAAKFISKNGKQVDSWKYGKEWLNAIGSNMKEFMTLKKGSPNQDYKESKMGGDHMSNKYGGLSQNKADKGSAGADLRGKAKGDTTYKSTEGNIDISKKEQSIGFGKAGKGQK